MAILKNIGMWILGFKKSGVKSYNGRMVSCFRPYPYEESSQP